MADTRLRNQVERRETPPEFFLREEGLRVHLKKSRLDILVISSEKPSGIVNAYAIDELHGFSLFFVIAYIYKTGFNHVQHRVSDLLELHLRKFLDIGLLAGKYVHPGNAWLPPSCLQGTPHIDGTE